MGAWLYGEIWNMVASMQKLLSDEEVADLLGISVKALHKRRDKERGGIYNGQRLDLLPRWVEVPGRTRAQGTPVSEVEAWIERHLI